MEVKFFKAVYNEYDRSQGTGVYRIEELFDASELFEDHRFRYVEFAQPCTSSDLEEDILSEDTPFVQDENFEHFKDAYSTFVITTAPLVNVWRAVNFVMLVDMTVLQMLMLPDVSASAIV